MSNDNHRKTADGRTFKECDRLYYINKVDDKIEEFNKSELLCTMGGAMQEHILIYKKDGAAFTMFSQHEPIYLFYSHIDKVRPAFIVHLKDQIDFNRKKIETSESAIKILEDKIERTKQDAAPYLKDTSDKKPEKFGNVRI